MGGPGSGDRPHSPAELRRRVIDKAWKISEQALDGSLELVNKDKATIANSIVVKDMVGKEKIDSRVQISQEEKAILSKYLQGNRISQAN